MLYLNVVGYKVDLDEETTSENELYLNVVGYKVRTFSYSDLLIPRLYLNVVGYKVNFSNKNVAMTCVISERSGI